MCPSCANIHCTEPNCQRETIGKVSQALMEKQMEDTHSAHEQMQESLTEYDKTLFATVQDYKKTTQDSFFVVVLTKKERLMPNVLRNYFFGRRTCPSPDYDQILYRYDAPCEKLDFVWVIPSKEACQHLVDNALQVPKEEKDLLQYVLDFADGTLYKKMKIYNNEQSDSNLLQ